MISTIAAVFALAGAAIAMPAVRPAMGTPAHAPASAPVHAPTPAPAPAPASAPSRPNIAGMLASGGAFEASGTTTAGAAADKDSGVAAGSLMGLGNVFGIAGPGLAAAGAMTSPTL